MKMRLQIASLLPAPAKAEPVGSQGKGVFGATLQAVMGLPDTARTQLASIGTTPGNLAQLNTNNEAGKLDGPIEELAGQVQWMSKDVPSGSSASGSFPARPADQRAPIEEPIGAQAEAEKSAVSKELLTAPVVQAPITEQAILQSSAVKMPQVTAGKNDLIPQPNAAAKPYLTALTKKTSPQLSHKTETKHGLLEAAAGQSSGMVEPLLVPSDVVVPFIAAQLDGSHPAPPQQGSKIASSHLRGPGQSSRAPIQSMTSSQAAASSKSFAAGSQLLADPGAVAAGSGKAFRGAMSVSAERIAGSIPAAPNKAKSSANIVVSPARPLPSKAAHSVAEGSEGAAGQIDVRPVKGAEQKTGTELKSEVKVSMAAQSSLGPVERQAATDLPPANSHGSEKGIATQRPEASAAQMLQRMDMAASPGVVQLRADARRLDVGVSSATLGWVEVRATSGPSGRIDATLQTQNDASAHVLAGQSSEISSYAREHSVHLGQVSVGVGTGGSPQGESRSTRDGAQDENVTPRDVIPTREVVRSQTSTQHHASDVVSLINVRV